MQARVILLIARLVWKNAFKSSASYVLLGIMGIITAYAAYSGYRNYEIQNEIREHYQQEARASWESNPDKHPHRMAHYGSFAFRLKHPLSMFDFGMESFTGNAVYLEAHKQNTVNFSEASSPPGSCDSEKSA
jgi:ABC-2 type transport system permease protein